MQEFRMADELQMAALVASPKATLTVRNGTELTLRFEGHAHYSIWVPETLSLNLPAAAILTNNSIVAAPTIILWADPGELVLQGPLVANGQESTMASADTTLTLRLVDDMWMPAVGRIACDACPNPIGLDHSRDRLGDADGDGVLDTIDDEVASAGCPCAEGDVTARYTPDGRNASMALLEELISQREGVGSGQPSGWNNVVRRVLLESGYFEPRLWRVDDHTLNVTIPQQLSYDIDIPETISLDAPRASLLSDRPLDVPPTLVIMPTAGRAYINGSLLFGVTEVMMRNQARNPLELLVRLQNDSWVESLGQVIIPPPPIHPHKHTLSPLSSPLTPSTPSSPLTVPNTHTPFHPLIPPHPPSPSMCSGRATTSRRAPSRRASRPPPPTSTRASSTRSPTPTGSAAASA